MEAKRPEELTKMTQANTLANLVPSIMNAIGGGDVRTQQALQQQKQRNNARLEGQKEQMFMRSIMTPGSGEVTQELIMQQASLYGIQPQKAMQLFTQFDSYRKAKAQETRAKEKEIQDKTSFDAFKRLQQGVKPSTDSWDIDSGLGASNAGQDLSNSLNRSDFGTWQSLKRQKEKDALLKVQQAKNDAWTKESRGRKRRTWEKEDDATSKAQAVDDAWGKIISMGAQGDTGKYIANLPLDVQAGVKQKQATQKLLNIENYRKGVKFDADIKKINADTLSKLDKTKDKSKKFISEGNSYTKRADAILKKYPIGGYGEMQDMANAGDATAAQDFKNYQRYMKKANKAYDSAYSGPQKKGGTPRRLSAEDAKMMGARQSADGRFFIKAGDGKFELVTIDDTPGPTLPKNPVSPGLSDSDISNQRGLPPAPKLHNINYGKPGRSK